MKTLQEQRDELAARIKDMDTKIAKEELAKISNKYYKRKANFSNNMDEYVKTLGINKDNPMCVDTVNILKSLSYTSTSVSNGTTQSMYGYTEIIEAEFWTTVESLIPNEIILYFKTHNK